MTSTSNTLAQERSLQSDGGIRLGGWPLAALPVVVAVAAAGILLVVGFSSPAFPAVMAVILACGAGFLVGMVHKLRDIRRRDYLPVSRGIASQSETAALDRLHPKLESLRTRLRVALTSAVAGVGATAVAAWWAHRSLTDLVVALLVVGAACLVSTSLGASAARRIR